MTNEEQNFLKMLNKHGGYCIFDSRPKDNALYVYIDEMYYTPIFQFESLSFNVKREVKYLLNIISKRKLSNVRKINFFLVPIDPFVYNVIDMINDDCDVETLIMIAEKYGTNNLL